MRRLVSAGFWLGAMLGAISLGAAAGPVVWQVAVPPGPVATALPQTPPEAPPQADLDPILASAPFGAPGIEIAPPVRRISGETSLGLVLNGVTVAVPASASRTIIAGGDNPAQIYRIGDPVTSTAILHEVHPTHVVLEVEGRLETLSFPQEALSGGPVSQADLATGDAVPEVAPPADADAVIARYRAAIQLNPQTVLDRLGLEATAAGYRITQSAAPGVLQAGFRPGDVVSTVNGLAVGDVETDRASFDTIAASGRARVEVQRDGQTIVMSFPLR